MDKIYDVVIIGAGPSGLMAGITAKEKNNVLIIEKNSHPGKKLLITGNGRCNVTNLKEKELFINNICCNQKFLYSAITKFGPQQIVNYFNNNGVKLKEEENNKIFPVSNKSEDILNALMNDTKGLETHYKETVIDINILGEIKEITTNKAKYQAYNIIVATGGASYQYTGSTGDHIKFSKKLNQPTVALYPCETGIITIENYNLQGTSVNDVIIKCSKIEKPGNLIFTHKGLSGSAIMDLSGYIYVNNVKELAIDLLPQKSAENILIEINDYNKEKEIITFLSTYFSKKLSEYIIEKLELTKIKIKSLNKNQKETLIRYIKNFQVRVKEVEKLDYSYATGGGVDIKYIDSTTMESKVNKGIYFVGETLDVTGPIGGYNITIALSTGYLAGTSIK